MSKQKHLGFLNDFFGGRMKQLNKCSTNPQSILVKWGLHLLTRAMCQQELLLWCHEHTWGHHSLHAQHRLTHLTHFISGSVFPDQPQPLVSSAVHSYKIFCHGQPDFSSAQVGHFTFLVLLSRDQPSPSLLGRGQLQPCHHIISSSTYKTSVTAKKTERFGKMPARLSAGRGGEESPVTTRWLSLANLAFSSRMTFFHLPIFRLTISVLTWKKAEN